MSIFNNFNNGSQEVSGPHFTLQFNLEKKSISLAGNDAPKSLLEAFQRVAHELGTSPDANVTFRAQGLEFNSELAPEAGAHYTASVQSDGHGC